MDALRTMTVGELLELYKVASPAIRHLIIIILTGMGIPV